MPHQNDPIGTIDAGLSDDITPDDLSFIALLMGVAGLMLLPILGVLLFLLIGVSVDALPQMRGTSATTAAFSLTTFAHHGEERSRAEEAPESEKP